MSDGMQAVTRRIATHEMNNGTKLVISSLGLQDFVAAREESLSQYKRQQIKTWTGNVDLIPSDKQESWVREAFDRAERLTYEDLPRCDMKLPLRDKRGKPVLDDRGRPVKKTQKVEYAMWWMSETPAGRLFLTWLSLRAEPSQQHMTLNDADALFIDAMELEAVAQKVGDLSNPTLGDTEGNSQTPSPMEAKGKRKRKRRKDRRAGR